MSGVDVQQVSREYFGRIHRAALVLSGNPWDADDLAQETFLVVSRQGASFQGRSSVYTWLYGILLNLERRRRRQFGVRNRHLRVFWQQETDQTPSEPSADAAVEVDEWRRSLWGFVAQLPDGQRQTLVLRYSENLPYDAIAEILQCPLGTVKSRIHHGLAGLKSLLAHTENDPLQLTDSLTRREKRTHAV